jgi:hypothetical protein
LNEFACRVSPLSGIREVYVVRSALREPITAMTGRVEALDFVDIVELVPLRLCMNKQGYLERRFVGTGIELRFHLEALMVNFNSSRIH